jgi:ankyrin repeat protein
MLREKNLFIHREQFRTHVDTSPELNEALVKLSKEGILGLFVASNTLEAKTIALARQQELFKKFNIKYEILLYDNIQQTIQVYTPYQQILDFTSIDILKRPNDAPRFKAIFNGEIPRDITSEQALLLLKIPSVLFNPTLFTALLEKYPEIVNKRIDGSPLIVWAAENGHLDIVKALLEKGADVNLKDNFGHTALIWTAKNGRLDIVKALLEKGVNVNLEDSYGCTALIRAAQNGHLDIVKALLEKGADVNLKDNLGHTALTSAAQNGHLDIVKALLEKGADVNLKDKNGDNALMCAEKTPHLLVMIELIKKHISAELNATKINGTPLIIWAVEYGRLDIVKELLEKGADVNLKDKYGHTALIRAAYNGRLDIVKALLEKGADVNLKDNFGHTTLIWAARKDRLDIVKALLEKGVNVNLEDSYGCTALKWAARNGHLTVIEELIKKQTPEQLNETKIDEIPLIIWAAQNGHLNIVNTLLEKGADVNLKNDAGDTALNIAIRQKNFPMIRLLLTSNKDIQPLSSNNKPEIIEDFYALIQKLWLFRNSRGMRIFSSIELRLAV